jgi:hypothetical protein
METEPQMHIRSIDWSRGTVEKEIVKHLRFQRELVPSYSSLDNRLQESKSTFLPSVSHKGLLPFDLRLKSISKSTPKQAKLNPLLKHSSQQWLMGLKAKNEELHLCKI